MVPTDDLVIEQVPEEHQLLSWESQVLNLSSSWCQSFWSLLYQLLLYFECQYHEQQYVNHKWRHAASHPSCTSHLSKDLFILKHTLPPNKFDWKIKLNSCSSQMANWIRQVQLLLFFLFFFNETSYTNQMDQNIYSE